MKTVMLVVLCFLGLFSIQGSTAIESYAAYYAELVMESSDVPYITDEQKIVDLITVDLIPVTLAYLNITTECRIVGDKTNCTCKGDYIWSNDVCRSHSACCNMDHCITQTSNYTPMCTPKSRVTVIGSLTLQEIFDPDLADNSSETFQSKSIYLATSLKKTFSEFSGFDSLVITQFRKGSVIADFEMIVNVHFTSSELAMKTRAIEEYLNASIALQTIGLVIMKIPEVPVCFASEQTLSCEFKEAVDGMWTLTKETINEIVNGSEVSIRGQGSIITLHRTSDHWKGTYTCAFLADKIYHKASGDLDIALLPEIVNKFYEPQFPDCIPDDQLRLIAKITYEIENEKEHYIVAKVFKTTAQKLIQQMILTIAS
ncbi:hypothetical protein AAFF_G00411060 [Aldrovandia affinis]|uniref:SEA domain-containing protein n=1 Tax=Aldrovandia affinis TaxID=143900 RepID=A0AAD7SBC3_9TELE|nr:hypothetical protein AAFF_G00411060 [Aldrovandia affinis]